MLINLDQATLHNAFWMPPHYQQTPWVGGTETPLNLQAGPTSSEELTWSSKSHKTPIPGLHHPMPCRPMQSCSMATQSIALDGWRVGTPSEDPVAQIGVWALPWDRCHAQASYSVERQMVYVTVCCTLRTPMHSVGWRCFKRNTTWSQIQGRWWWNQKRNINGHWSYWGQTPIYPLGTWWVLGGFWTKYPAWTHQAHFEYFYKVPTKNPVGECWMIYEQNAWFLSQFTPESTWQILCERTPWFPSKITS